MPDVDVVVIGAGLAGLGAATALRDAGRQRAGAGGGGPDRRPRLDHASRRTGRRLVRHGRGVAAQRRDQPAGADRAGGGRDAAALGRTAASSAPSSARARRRRRNTPTTPAPGSASRTEAAEILRTRDDVPLAEVARSHAGRSVGGDGGDLGRPDHLLRQRRRVQRCATGCATCCRAATWCRRAASAPSSPGGWARVWTSGWRTPVTRVAWSGAGVAVETPRGTITARLGDRHRLHRRAGGRRDRVRSAAAARDAGRDPCAADGAGDEGGVARHRTGSARPAAALLGRSPGEAQRRSHHGVPVLALQT